MTSVCRLHRSSMQASTCGMLLVALCSIDPPPAQAQSLATVDQSPKVHCRYRSATGREKTGIVPGLKSCDEGEATKQIVYVPCGEAQMVLARGDLTVSEVDCAGNLTTPNELAAVIKGKIVEIKGDDVTVAYPTAFGKQTFSLQKYNLKGLRPELDSNIVFFSTDLLKKTEPNALAKDFEKFKIDASQGGLLKGPQNVVGVVVK